MKQKNEPIVITILLLLGLAALSSNLILADVGHDVLGSNSIDDSSNEDFTVVVLPDTQGYVEDYPWLFDSQTQWIVDNKETLNIVFVSQLGDLVNDPDNLMQWENANKSMSKLGDNVPWAVLPGNHDMFEGNLTNYNTYFGYARFSGKSWYGGTHAAGDNANNYELFSAGGNGYIIFHIQYNPSDDVLFWASNVISQYPERRVIVSTHDYLMGFAKRGQRSDIGERIWHSLIRPHADQIFLVLCGHAGVEDLIIDTVDGHVVYQMLADYQNKSNVESGWLRLLQFCPEQNTIQVKTYSPYLNKYKTDPESDLTLNYSETYQTKVVPASPAAENTVYIREDGSVEPSTAPIQRSGNVYTFTADLYVSIVVERNNVVIDGADFTLKGTGADDYRPSYETPDMIQGVYGYTVKPDPYVTPDSNNTGVYSCAEKLTIKNLKITEFWCGIELEYSSDNCIVENEVTSSTYGVWIHQSSNDTISGNIVRNNKHGVTLTTTHNNIHGNRIINNEECGLKLYWSFNYISGNSIESNHFGVSLEDSSHNVFGNNSFSKNSRVFHTAAHSFLDFVQDADSSNLVDGKPIYYWIDKQDLTAPADAGWVALVNCTRMRVENLDLAFGQEILLIGTTHSTVTGNMMATNDVCIYLDESLNNTIAGNTLTDSYYGIQLDHSSGNDIEHNNVTGNTRGIYLDYSLENSIHGNDLTRNIQGITLSVSTSNSISGNNLAANGQGIHFSSVIFWESMNEGDTTYDVPNIYGASYNCISRNNLVGNTYGVWISLSSNNTFSSNNFINNTHQANFENPLANSFTEVNPEIIENVSASNWDDGTTGNYWGDYEGRYPNASKLDGSGTWNTPYIINENNRDNYPLVNPIKISDDAPFLLLLLVLAAVLTAAVVALGIGIYRNKRKLG